ncbi:MAG: hypothetical protein J6R40_05810, partial [Clostridia bacterium]|nr:hypothetical protein [Clostridia bacterium]
MKKSFLAMICIVFVASFVVVGLLGLEFRNTADIYTNRIECNEYRYVNGNSIGESHVFPKKNDKGENYDTLDYVEGMQILLCPQAYPIDAAIFTKIDVEDRYVFHS